MSRHLQLNRFFVHPQYSIYYRLAKKLHWDSEGRLTYGIFFLLRGELTFQSGAGGGSLKKNQALLIEPTNLANVAGKNVETLLLVFSPALLLDYAARMRLVIAGANIAFSAQSVNQDSHLVELLRGLAGELAEEKAGREIVIAAAVEQTIVHLLRHYSNMRRSEELELSRVGLIDRRIRRAVELMHAQLDQELPLREIAAASYLSPFHFARLFKKLTGATPHSYLASLRTTRAQQMLAQTDLSITTISAQVGYASASHFTKAFRQATGLTPRAFRSALVSR